MGGMFESCVKLISLNLSHFDTSQVTQMYDIFYNCKSLTLLDLSSFEISNVTDISSMFSYCNKLLSLNLSNFVTSSVTSMGYMFTNCSSLSQLDLSNFNTSKVISMKYMFSGCTNLEYLNIKNFSENESLYVKNIFDGIPDNIVICLNENSDKILSELQKSINCYTIYCLNDWRIYQKKLINVTNICLDTYDNPVLYKYEYKGKYYENCTNGNLINNSIIKSCQCYKEISISYSNEPINEILCTKCNYNYYQKENENDSYIENYIKCYKDPIGYYLDKKELVYKKCFYTCEKCDTKGDIVNHNCSTCKNNYPYEIEKNNYFNCYDNIININNIINNETKEKTKEEEIKYYDTILKGIETSFTSKNYNTSDLDNGKDEIIETEKMKVIFTTIQNQKNSINNNMTNIDLGECEKYLRNYYNLTNNESLYMKKIEINQQGMKIPKIEYDVYSKLSGENLIKLNLSICQNSSISLLIPVEISENFDQLNSSSEYYNDICYTTTSTSGTDISLKDRKNEFTSKTVCQEDCDISDYNYTLKKVNCSCKVKESSNSFLDMNINTTKLFGNFRNIKNIANFNLLKCVDNLFSKLGISKNVGCFILIAIIILRIISLFVFYLKQLRLLKEKIKDIIYAIKNIKLIKDNSKIKEESKKKNKKDNCENEINLGKIKNIIIDKDTNSKDLIINNIDNNKKVMIKTKNNKKRNKSRGKKNKNEKGNYININNKNCEINNDKLNNIPNNENKVNKKVKKNVSNIITENKKDIINKKVIKKIKRILEYNDDEINSLPYDLALEYDKRSYCQYYISLIKTKHNFFFSFIYYRDYNSKIIKIDLFFIGFTINYTINALFYNDDTMHNIYINKGSFDIEYQLPKIVYSSLIGIILETFMKMLALSNDDIIEFKQNKKNKNVNKSGNKLKIKLNIKFILYFILSFIVLLFSWYYLSMFGAVFRNTQFYLLKDTLISFGLSLIYPFGINLIPGFFRIPALGNPKKKREYLYKLSKILQIF